MIRSLKLRNFKSWRDLNMSVAPISVLFGSNSSGKTSAIQSLVLMKQTVASPDRNQYMALSGLADLGSYGDILFRGSVPARLGFEIVWDADVAVPGASRTSRSLRLRSATTIVDGSPRERALEYAVFLDDGSATDQHATQREVTFNVAPKDKAESANRRANEFALEADGYTVKPAVGRKWPLSAPGRFYTFPPETTSRYTNVDFLDDFELDFENLTRRMRYLGPVRMTPTRTSVYSGGSPGDVGSRGEAAIDLLIAARDSGRKLSRGWTSHDQTRRQNKKLVEVVIAEWLVELGLAAAFSISEISSGSSIYQVLVRRTSGSPEVPLTDVGFGVSQVLPFLIQMACSERGDVILVEQPELHLHPSAQFALADIVVETSLFRGIQFIVESHSEHFLSRLQTRVAERFVRGGLELSPEDVAVYACEMGRSGVSTALRLKLQENGDLDHWPADFFGDAMGEIVRRLEAPFGRES